MSSRSIALPSQCCDRSDPPIAEFKDEKGPCWIHVSYISKDENRGNVYIATKENGRTKYLRYTEELYKKIYG